MVAVCPAEGDEPRAAQASCFQQVVLELAPFVAGDERVQKVVPLDEQVEALPNKGRVLHLLQRGRRLMVKIIEFIQVSCNWV